jgi:lambda family phage portal protein
VRLITQKFGDSKVPLGLELIESDRLDDFYNGRADNGNEIRMGVEIDQWSKPVAYYFFAYHPGDYPFAGQKVTVGGRRMRIPAEEIVHPFIMERANQTRGVPWLVSAIMKLHHMQGYEEAEVIAARAAASLMGFIQSPEGELQGDAVVDKDRVTDFQPGTWKYLQPGEQVVIPKIDRPGGQFAPFNEIMLRGVAAGVGTSYETLSKDYSKSNFSSSRLALLSERELWRILQQWIIDNFHQVIFEKWLDLAVLSGEISIPGYELDVDKYHDVRWRPRGWPWVDPLKEVSANRDAILGGLTSISKIVEAEGDDLDDLFEEIARERKLAKEKGLVFDTDAENGIKPVLPPKPGKFDPTPEDPNAPPEPVKQ